jgi:hypothetical protein
MTMSETNEYAIEGGCLCGAVRFALTEMPTLAGYCHCTRCQRRTGTAASPQARIDGKIFRLLAGEEQIRGWRPPALGFEKCFCTECGAHLLSRNADGSQMSIRMGAFDVAPGVRLSYRQFVSYAASWEPIPDDGLEHYPEARPR